VLAPKIAALAKLWSHDDGIAVNDAHGRSSREKLTLKTVATLATVPYTIALLKRTALHQSRTRDRSAYLSITNITLDCRAKRTAGSLSSIAAPFQQTGS